MTAGVVGINAGSPLAVEENGVSGSFRPVLSVRFFPIPFFRIRFFPVLSPLAVEENWVSGSFPVEENWVSGSFIRFFPFPDGSGRKLGVRFFPFPMAVEENWVSGSFPFPMAVEENWVSGSFHTVAIQTGADPSKASIKFYWGEADDGTPAAFVPDRNDERHWFGNGVRVGNRLLLFLNRVRNSDGGLGFESAGWTAWMVDNPDSEPSAWQMRELKTPENSLGVLVGFAAVLQLGGHVYAFGSEDPVKSHPIYAARWTAEQVVSGRLLAPEWWAGHRLGWVADASRAPRWPLFENGQSELSIHWEQATQRFLGVNTQGFGAADVVIRAAPALTGPWSAPRMLYRPTEYYRPNAMIYAAKAHQQLAGGDLLLTYASNSFRFSEMISDHSIYFPRFVRLMRCP